MISANEANQRISECNYSKHVKQIAKIEKCIERAVDDGHNKCTVDFIVCGSVGTELIRLGYVFKSGCARNESYTIISW